MSLTKITNKSLATSTVLNANIADNTINGSKLAPSTITRDKLASDTLDSNPVGTIIYYAGNTPPTGYLIADGSILDRQVYSELFAAIGTLHNLGSETGAQFRIPDLRGEFIRGWDQGRGVDQNRVFGSFEDYGTAKPKKFDHTTRLSHPEAGIYPPGNANAPHLIGFARVTRIGESATTASLDAVGSGYDADVLNVMDGDEETRPRNIALLPCIKFANGSFFSPTAIDVQALAATKLNVTGGVMTGDLRLNNGAIIRRIITFTDSATYSTTTTWAQGPVFPNITDLRAESFIRLTMHTPMRNDSGSWGGGYIEPQISYNNGASWISLGSCGYDGAVMNIGGGAIGSYFQQLLIFPQQMTNYSFRVRIMFRSYDSTVIINGSHDINNVSGTAPLITGLTSANQHFCKIIVEELL